MVQLKSVRPWHEQIVDVLLARPEWSQGQIAEYFDVSEPWLSSVMHSDVFQAYYARRMATHQEKVSDTVIERVEGLAKISLDKLQERVENLGEDFPLSPVRETCEMALKALGFGGGRSAAPVQVNVGVVPRELLEEARVEYRQHQHNLTLAPAEFTEVPKAAAAANAGVNHEVTQTENA